MGSIINAVAIILGGGLGLLLSNRLSERLRHTIMSMLGLFTLAYGMSLFLQTQNVMIVLASLLVGVLLGEWWRIEEGVESLGAFFEKRFNRNGNTESERFIRGFMSTSLLFVIGPMAILGAIQDGLAGDINTLVIKAVLDGFAAMAFASSLSLGVLFSSLPVLVYQGVITLLAHQVQRFVSEAMMTEMVAAGGVLLLAISISSLLELRKIRVGSFLPALVLAPLLVWLLATFNISLK
ncbi:MAG: DUF554 domain-containing protein [Anaerolineaceae bacterium]|nr:DUF554 domain-containing protein [Anaerolineaceae bacterium]